MASEQPKEQQVKPAAAAEKPKSTAKLDEIAKVEHEMQADWEAAHLFESDAKPGQSKYFVTFPYPYMNGTLHLGHSFTVTKAEFAVRYRKLKGDNVLFPFGFHCTGMPIMACATKLKQELTTYGCPPKFPVESAEAAPAPVPENKKQLDPSKHTSKRAKASQKGSNKRQWQILQSNGIPESEIPQFQDPLKWLSYFPPIGKEDLKTLGIAVDWRRSFITTEVNPFYDSFVRWQFFKLRDMKKVEFGKRFSVYSPLDGQPCADHDRSSGEGVLPQDYVAIKIAVAKPFPESCKLKPLEHMSVFLVAGTLRPETMYGQTNCWIHPELKYGAFAAGNNEVFICTFRAARNFAFQGFSEEPGKVKCLLELTGADLMGLPLKAPLTSYPIVYTLPMLTIQPDKGTGVVTSVPSDSPDDYMNFMQLKTKPEYCKKLGIKEEWIMPFEVIPIIDVPEYGKNAAETVCAQLKIKSPNDSVLLEQAKQLTYLKGFYTGKMCIGPYAGKPVQEVKNTVRDELIASNQAVSYSEPANKVMSRSGDECVVSLCDQWYLKYGEPEWKAQTQELMKKMEMYHQGSADVMARTLDIFSQWGCSRSFGLGTRLPWDPKYLIESLSDSTIYMAYYTVAHLLQGGVLDGSKLGPANIKPEQMTPAVWDFILLGGEYPADCGVTRETLEKLRAEFDYWYPFDLRVSGKDLLSNHLLFCLYNHAAIFPNKGPRAFRANGHLLIDNEKMAKSTGNFLSLHEAISMYSADGTRIALADAGDGLDDANFLRSTADSSLLRLHTQKKWIEDVLVEKDDVLGAGHADNFHDHVFVNMVNRAVRDADKAYERLMFREALLHAFHDMLAARDLYRSACEELGIPMKRELIMWFLEVQAVIMSPITPHFSDYVYRKLLHKSDFIWHATWPSTDEIDVLVLQQSEHLESCIYEFRQLIRDYLNPKKKKGQAQAPQPAYPQQAEIVVATAFPYWHSRTMELLSEEFSKTGQMLPNDKVAPLIAADPQLKKSMRKIMAVVSFLQEAVNAKGKAALQSKLPFDEAALFRDHLQYITKVLRVPNITIRVTDAVDENAKLVPGKPAFVLPKAC
eukprot:TRINITY_DN64_c0_g4_i1.p1 TRINITY_DN64_c0_g4~~TRINITY_DN64_c0_g4_i1.p1  ORF type:complete len:1079 (-),score=347.02 TRINITY_DN64_c0_g4_i1:3286-6522(-)